MNEALRARIITALLLAALVVVVLLRLPAEVAVVLISAAIFIAGYEWAGFARLLTKSARFSYAAAILLALTGAEMLANDPRWLELILRGAALWWLLAFVWLAVRAKAGGRLAAAAGFVVLVPAGIGLSHLVTLQPDGRLLLLYLLVLIAAADVGAYFGGRTFGRRKLAPHVSPGKTWEGFAAGMLAAAIVAVAGAALFEKPFWPWLFLCELVALVSVVGDLTESMFKRHVGLKDSGRLLPGHGGILDRIDSLTAAAPTFLLGLFALGLTS
jgi:phosphatidate cytidylyltransferase